MKVIFLNGREFEGVNYERGDMIDLPDHKALFLIDSGDARAHEPPGPTETKQDPGAET